MLLRSLRHICAALALTFTLFQSSAGITDLPVKEINGLRYHYYEVQPRETVYGITHKLGITAEVLYTTNPSTRDGLKARQVLLFPVEERSSMGESSPAAAPRRTHLVRRGETVYGISKKYGITKEQIFEWNPESADGIKAGQTLTVSAPSDPYGSYDSAPGARPEVTPDDTEAPAGPAPAYAAASSQQYTDYEVRDKETFYSIARAHGITIHELEAANPDVGILRSGDTIRIPVAGPTTPVPAEDVATDTPAPSIVTAAPDSASAMVSALDERPVDLARRPVNIALTLPLMTSNPSKLEGNMFVDFYKGFLIAVDSLRHCGSPINIRTYDTHGSADTLMAILRSPDFERPDVIVGSDSEAELEALASYASENQVYVFNPFVVRDEMHLTNPMMMQANIPQAMMYDKAIEGLITRYADHLPVFVSSQECPDDKKAFVEKLRARLTQAGIDSREITFKSHLSQSDIEALPADRPLLFIPMSGRQPELNKLLPAIVEARGRGRNAMLFGYPEWISFRGETLRNMHKAGTVIYSRFINPDDNSAVDNLDGRFRYWYGQPMQAVLPRQGVLGFDTGMYLIEAVRRSGGDLQHASITGEGIQNGFHFIRPESMAGLVNDVLYFVSFGTDGTVDTVII